MMKTETPKKEDFFHPRKNLVHRSYNQSYNHRACVREFVQDIFFLFPIFSHLSFFFLSLYPWTFPPSIDPPIIITLYIHHHNHPPPFLLTNELLPAPAPDPDPEEILSGLKIPLEPPPPPPPPAPVPLFPIRGLLM